MCEKHKKTRPGATLDNQAAHEQDHRLWSRRDFLSASGLVGAGTAAAVVDLADAEPTASLSLAEDRR